MFINKSISKLREICQPEAVVSKNAWYARKVARKLSIYFTWLMVKTNLSANFITFLSILICILAGLCFAVGTGLMVLLGALALQFWYIFDHVDGEIARYRGQSNLTGKYFDYVSHYICHPYIFLSLAIGAYNFLGAIWILYLGIYLAFAAVLLLIIYDCSAKAIMLEVSRQISTANVLPKNTAAEVSSEKLKIKSDVTNVLKMIFDKFDNFIYYVNRFYNVLNVVTIVAMLNFFFPYINLFAVTLTPVAWLIIFYAITFSLNWTTRLYLTMRGKLIDQEYHEFIQKVKSL